MRHVLLMQETRPDEWPRWFRVAGMPHAAWRDGPVFEHFLMLAHAAAAGMGVALLPRFLIDPELQSGALVQLLPDALVDERAYYFVWPSDRNEHRSLSRFCTWLTSEAAGPG